MEQGDKNLEGCGILMDEVLHENVFSLRALAALGPRNHPLRDIDGLIVWESRQSVGDVSKVWSALWDFGHCKQNVLSSLWNLSLRSPRKVPDAWNPVLLSSRNR
jgi:hypothetical protein